MTFAEKVKEIRKQLGLSQEQLAERLMISRSAIARWESDLGTPDLDNLKTLSQLSGFSIDDLLDESKSLYQIQMSNTYCGKSCDGCTYQERLHCNGCKAYSHNTPGGCAIARCCQDRHLEDCQQCNYYLRCNKLQTRMQQPTQRLSVQIRYAETQARNESILQQAEARLTLLSKYIPLLFKVAKVSIAIAVLQLVLKRFIPNLDQWYAIPSCIISIVYSVILLRMFPIHSGYRIAGLLSLIIAPITCVTSFLGANTISAILVTTLASMLEMAGKRYEYTAHADVMTDIDSELAHKWRNLWYWQMLFICVTLMSTLLAMITWLPIFVSLISVCTLALLVVSCLEWVYLSRSAKLFQDYPISALLNRVRHRLNSGR